MTCGEVGGWGSLSLSKPNLSLCFQTFFKKCGFEYNLLTFHVRWGFLMDFHVTKSCCNPHIFIRWEQKVGKGENAVFHGVTTQPIFSSVQFIWKERVIFFCPFVICSKRDAAWVFRCLSLPYSVERLVLRTALACPNDLPFLQWEEESKTTQTDTVLPAWPSCQQFCPTQFVTPVMSYQHDRMA